VQRAVIRIRGIVIDKHICAKLLADLGFRPGRPMHRKVVAKMDLCEEVQAKVAVEPFKRRVSDHVLPWRDNVQVVLVP
jgi:hypothetical protein